MMTKVKYTPCRCNNCKDIGGKILCTATKSKLIKKVPHCNKGDLTLEHAAERRAITEVIWHRYLNNEYEPEVEDKVATYDGRDIIVQS